MSFFASVGSVAAEGGLGFERALAFGALKFNLTRNGGPTLPPLLEGGEGELLGDLVALLEIVFEEVTEGYLGAIKLNFDEAHIATMQGGLAFVCEDFVHEGFCAFEAQD